MQKELCIYRHVIEELDGKHHSPTQKSCNSFPSYSVLTVDFKAAQDQTPLPLWFPSPSTLASLMFLWHCRNGAIQVFALAVAFALNTLLPDTSWPISQYHLLNAAYFDQPLPPVNIATWLRPLGPLYPALHFYFL